MWLDRTIVWGNGALLGAQEIGVAASAALWIGCSDVDPARILVSGVVIWLEGNFVADPMFCTALDPQMAPTANGDYHLREGSPCSAEESPCAVQVGALSGPCTASSAPEPIAGLEGVPWRARVLPNPVRGAFQLELLTRAGSVPKTWASLVHVASIDASGRRIGSVDLLGGARMLPLDDAAARLLLPTAGLYALEVRAGDVHTTVRVLALPR